MRQSIAIFRNSSDVTPKGLDAKKYKFPFVVVERRDNAPAIPAFTEHCLFVEISRTVTDPWKLNDDELKKAVFYIGIVRLIEMARSEFREEERIAFDSTSNVKLPDIKSGFANPDTVVIILEQDKQPIATRTEKWDGQPR